MPHKKKQEPPRKKLSPAAAWNHFTSHADSSSETIAQTLKITLDQASILGTYHLLDDREKFDKKFKRVNAPALRIDQT